MNEWYYELTIEVHDGDASQRYSNPNTTSKENTSPPGRFRKCFLIGTHSLLPLNHDLIAHFLELPCDEVVVLAGEMKFLDQLKSAVIIVLFDKPSGRL